MKTLLLLSSCLLAPSLFAQSGVPKPFLPTPADSCPIQVNEAWLNAPGTTIVPADAGRKSWRLHISFANKSEKDITGFIVHADLALRPDGSVAPKQSQHIHRRWMGEVASMDHKTEEWKITAAPNTAGLDRVWFDRVRFADGSTWEGDNGATCSFAATGHMVPAKDPSE